MIIQTEALRVVETVARYRSFSAAAERLHKVPSAISYTVRKLEETIGTQLFLREGKQVELTAEGRYFLEHARDILRDLETLQADITQLHGGVEQQFRVGLNNLLNPAPLAGLAADLHQRFTACRQSYRTEVYNGVWDALIDRRIDLAIGAPNVLPQGADLSYLPMGEVHWDFVISPQHPLARSHSPLDSRELAAIPDRGRRYRFHAASPVRVRGTQRTIAATPGGRPQAADPDHGRLADPQPGQGAGIRHQPAGRPGFLPALVAGNLLKAGSVKIFERSI